MAEELIPRGTGAHDPHAVVSAADQQAIAEINAETSPAAANSALMNLEIATGGIAGAAEVAAQLAAGADKGYVFSPHETERRGDPEPLPGHQGLP